MDDRKWKQVWAQLGAMKNNVPETVDENFVGRYHSLVGMVGDSLSEDLSLFKIPDDQLTAKFLFGMLSLSGGRDQMAYSPLRYCDRAVFMAQLEAFIAYLESLVVQSTGEKRRIGF
jgi:hypothetical protein